MSANVLNQTLHLQKGNGIPSTVISVFTILLNGTSLVLIITNRTLEAKVKVCFVGHLLADFLFGIASLAVSQPALRDKFEVLCFVSIYSTLVFGTVTSLMTLLQTLDKFCVMKFTFSYTAWISAGKMTVIIVLIYIFSVVFILTMGLKSFTRAKGCFIFTACDKEVYAIISSLFSFCLILMVCMYIYIGKAVKRHMVQIRDATAAEQRPGVIEREQRNIVTITIIVGLYGLCYIPIIITGFHLFYYWETRVKYVEDNPLYLTVFLFMGNSLLNPIVYIWKLKAHRVNCRNMVESCFT